jgi:hypothetical protein
MQDVILIDVPEGDIVSYGLGIAAMHSGLMYVVFEHSVGLIERKYLPPGSWTIVEQTEEWAAKIVEKRGDYWKDYLDESDLGTSDYDGVHATTALASLHSWIRSQGKEPKTSIILKKEI